MKPIEFAEQTVIIAKDQPEYMPLPAHIAGDKQGTLTFAWRLTWYERLAILFSGVIWQQTLTFGSPLQPQLLTVEKPYMSKRKNEHQPT
jgi:hypothetical protein